MVQPVRTLRELARHGGSLRVTCRSCGRAALFSVRDTVDHFTRRHWPDDWDAVPQRFRCACGRRDVVVSWVEGPPPDPPGPPAPREVYAPPGVDPDAWAKAGARERRRMIRLIRS